MNKFKSFSIKSKTDDISDYYHNVRYIRESCKVFSDLWKIEKDFFNKSIDHDVVKILREFNSSDVAYGYHSQSILKTTIGQMIEIHEVIDEKRREWIRQTKELSEKAKEKQISIRQKINECRENYDQAQRKLVTAETSMKKFQNRPDTGAISDYTKRLEILEENLSECESNATNTRDQYLTEICRIASEEHSITKEFFAQFIFEEHKFYQEVAGCLAVQTPKLVDFLGSYPLAPSFGCDLAAHCEKHLQCPIAYPIETCIHLLEDSIEEEGLFRIAPSQIKQKKLLTELDLQLVDKNLSTLKGLAFDAHVPASTLKQYLRELPNCLLTSTLLTQWNEIPSLKSDEIRLQRIAQLIKRLPKVNYDNLCYLMRFLGSIAESSDENKMTPANLAICIGSSLLFSTEQQSNSSLPDSFTSARVITELMITYQKQLFPLQTSSNQQQDYSSSTRTTPTDLPKTSVPLNENLIDLSPQPSPKTTRSSKIRPPPPPVRSISRTISHQFESISTTEEQQPILPVFNEKKVSKTHHRSGSGGNQLERSNLLFDEEDVQKRSSALIDFSPEGNFCAELSQRVSKQNNSKSPNHRQKTSNSTGEITQF